jgi:homoserine O-acetyltransferase
MMIGPGKAFDTNRYFVVCSNFLGGCKGTTGPSSIDPATGKPYALDFPIFTVGDTVEVQRLLADRLGIERWLTMAGGSMGGMQALEWAVRYPGRLRSVIPMATTSRLSAQGIAFNVVGRNAIMSDGNWNGGNYYDADPPSRGLGVARMVGHITYLSEESMHSKFGRRLQFLNEYAYDFFTTEFQVESYLEYQGQSFVERFDANTYLYVTKAMDYFDLAAQHGGEAGTLEAALAKASAKFLVVSFSSDWLFPTWQSKEIVRALIAARRDVSYLEIQSSAGHDAFLLEKEQLTRAVSSFLENV